MGPSISSDQLWNALTEGGDVSRKAIASFGELPERQKDATFEQILRRAEEFVSTLIAEETTGSRFSFRELKAKFLRVLDAIPELAVTDALREVAKGRIAQIDTQSQCLTNIDITMKCDEVAEKLEPLSLSGLKASTVIECDSIEELQEKLANVMPAEVAADVVAHIEANLEQLILGSINTKNKKKKNPPPSNN